MTDLQIGISDTLLDDIRANMGFAATPEDVVQEALLLFLWATQAVADGRVLLSATPECTRFERVILTYEDAIRAQDPVARRAGFRLIVPVPPQSAE